MKYTIGQAAKATDKSKSTISRDVKEGRISAEKNDDGSYAIDASELIRVYPDTFDPNRSATPTENTTQQAGLSNGSEGLRADVERLLEQMQGLQAERDRERRQLTDQIDDLRRRLDTEGEERRKLTAILTDQRERPVEKPPEPAKVEEKRGLLRRLFG